MQKNRETAALLRQIIRFVLVGGTAFCIDYGLLILLTEKAHIPYLLSNAISFCISVCYNYLLSVIWVFHRNKVRKKTTEFTVFLLMSIIGLGINELLLWLCVAKLHIVYQIGKVVAAAVVMVYNYVSRKIFFERRSA